MKRYIGTKIVMAEPMTATEFNERVRPLYYSGADKRGYLVEYEDGYQSWSPKGVFEKAYRLLPGAITGKKAMLSQPMAGKSDAEIVATRERAIKALNSKGYEVINTLFTDEWYSKEQMEARGVVQIPLCFLAKSLESMSLCHAAYFCKGWENARGCRLEHEAAKAYGLDILYEE